MLSGLRGETKRSCRKPGEAPELPLYANRGCIPASRAGSSLPDAEHISICLPQDRGRVYAMANLNSGAGDRSHSGLRSSAFSHGGLA
jgi:hypothetical protein